MRYYRPFVVAEMDKSRIWVGTKSIENILLPSSWYRGGSGAVIDFRGCVRNLNEGRPVSGIEYDAFLPLAMQSLEEIRNETLQKYKSLEDLLIYHRVGLLNLGETSLIVGVASPHRKDAFAACQEIIDLIKKRTPVWKRELYIEGESQWLPGSSLAKEEKYGD